MDPSVIISTVGLLVALANPTPGQANKELITGTKVCEGNYIIKVLVRDETGTMYIKANGRVFVLNEREVDTGVRRFDSKDGTLIYIQQPHKAIVLDGVNMKPVLDECKNSA